MDPDLVEYLDRRFNELRNDLCQEFRTEVAASAAETRTGVRAEIAASAAETRTGVRAEVAASAAETRRHFDVVAEQLLSKIQLVGEGVIGLDQKVDRVAAEVRAEFQKVDRRFLHLEARLISALE